MLYALVFDLIALPDVQVVTMRGPRSALTTAQFPPLPNWGRGDVPATDLGHPCLEIGQSAYVSESERDFWPTFRRAVSESDAVWLIAPEQDGLLERLSREVVGARRRLLGSSPDAVHVAASKLSTAAALLTAGIRTIPTFADEQSVPADVDRIVVKPDDGAGCQDTYLFQRRADLRRWLRDHGVPGQIFQPYVHGTASSLSIVCSEGRARLLSANRQHVAISSGRFEFSGVSVNAIHDTDGRYTLLAQDVARALPGLWGYVGIDVIDATDEPIVVEINPRLTTAYAGLRQALGINVARLVLELPGSLEDSEPLGSRSVVDVEVAHAG